jgi:GNAT superfamily N-acetyltransferase
MDIVDLQEEHIPDLCRVYNTGITLVPHCYPVEVDRFQEGLAPALGEEAGSERLKNDHVLVALENGTPIGFAHLADHQSKNGNIDGAIRFLMYPIGRRAVGQALLDQAVERLRERDVIIAFHQYHRYGFYHRSCSYLSDRLGHVQSLLQVNGFKRDGGEIHFDWDGYNVDPGKAPFEVEMKRKIGDETDYRASVRVGAWSGDEEIAACEICSCGRWSDEPSVQDRLFVKWLGVEKEYQGRKLGEYTLLYAMRASHGIGYRHAAISTAIGNHRAFVFYSNIGFHVTDMTYLWVKKQGQACSE